MVKIFVRLRIRAEKGRNVHQRQRHRDSAQRIKTHLQTILPRSQSHPAKQRNGSGLVIVRSIIEKHDGKIFAESKGEGKGSTFVVRLPKKNSKFSREVQSKILN